MTSNYGVFLLYFNCSSVYIGCSFKFILKGGVEESIVNHGLRITDQLFKSKLTFCVVCVFSLQTDEWCAHNRLLNANFEEKFTSNIFEWKKLSSIITKRFEQFISFLMFSYSHRFHIDR
jgi:hypothetical protein